MEIASVVTIHNYNDQYGFFDVEVPVGKESSITLKGCKVIEGKNGKFVACKSEKRNDKYWPTAYINGDKLQKVIIEAVNEAKKASGVMNNDDMGDVPF